MTSTPSRRSPGRPAASGYTLEKFPSVPTFCGDLCDHGKASLQFLAGAGRAAAAGASRGPTQPGFLPGAGALDPGNQPPLEDLRPDHNQAEANLRTLLGIPDNYRVLFLQGGAILQFGMVAMNLLRDSGKPANYLVHGTWSQKASGESQDPRTVNVAGPARRRTSTASPGRASRSSTPTASTSICARTRRSGREYPTEPDTGSLPLICDSSSDFLSGR